MTQMIVQSSPKRKHEKKQTNYTRSAFPIKDTITKKEYLNELIDDCLHSYTCTKERK